MLEPLSGGEHLPSCQCPAFNHRVERAQRGGEFLLVIGRLAARLAPALALFFTLLHLLQLLGLLLGVAFFGTLAHDGGQGVGTAAALALRQSVLPADIAGDSGLMHAIQQQLLKDDCHLISVRNDDELDLVRKAAQITASQTKRQQNGDSGISAAILLSPFCCLQDPHAGPENIRSGQTRIVTKLLSDRQSHGLHRLLTLSQADGYTQKMLWSQPQPETVSDYELSLETPTGWQTVESIQNNHQRLRRHLLALAEPVTALRLTITATNGLDHARVVEVSAYG